MAYQRGLTFRSPAQMAGGRATALCGQQSWPPPAPAVLLLRGQGHGAAPGAHISHHGVASRGSSSMPCWLEHRTRASVCYILGSLFCTQRCRKMIRSRGRQQAMKRCTGWAQAGGTGSCTQDLGCQWSLGGVSATRMQWGLGTVPPGRVACDGGGSPEDALSRRAAALLCCEPGLRSHAGRGGRPYN